MDIEIDCQISDHVLRMHSYCSATDGGTRLNDSSRHDGEDGSETGSSIFVKYNRMLHRRRTDRGRKRDTLTINFLKKYINYAKNIRVPMLTDEACVHIATAYAELRNASSNVKTGGTLPITARTLETMIRLSTAHAKMKLQEDVRRSDVEAALRVLNFAIYHQELNEMEERDQEWQREERERLANAEAGTNDGDHNRGGKKATKNGRSTATTGDTEAMYVDEPPANEGCISQERLDAFGDALWRHMHAQLLEEMSIADIERVVNSEASVPYSAPEIMSLLKIMQEKSSLMIYGDNTDAVVYFL